MGGVIFWSVVVYLLIFFLFLKKKNREIIVKPNIGIEFLGKSLPFDDISSFSVQRLTGNGWERAFVQADTHGNGVRITGYTEVALANALYAEILEKSGRLWG